MKRLSPALIITSVIVAAWSVFSSLLITPANRQRDALDSDTRQKQLAAEALNRSAIDPVQFARRSGALQTAIASFEARLEPEGQIQAFIEEVWRLAEANSLETHTMRAPAEGAASAQLNISLTGNFAGFYQFLVQIEQMPRLIRVDRMNLARLGAANGQVQADVILQVFLRRPASGPAASKAVVLNDSRKSPAMSVEFTEDRRSDMRQWQTTLALSDAAIEALKQDPAALQTPLTDLKGNPFCPTGALASETPEVDSAAARRRQEEQREEAMRAVQALRLTSIISGSLHRACLINNALYQEGQEADGFSIEEITPSAVVVRKGIYRFELRVDR